jgi:hypothetical protein
LYGQDKVVFEQRAVSEYRAQIYTLYLLWAWLGLVPGRPAGPMIDEVVVYLDAYPLPTGGILGLHVSFAMMQYCLFLLMSTL